MCTHVSCAPTIQRKHVTPVYYEGPPPACVYCTHPYFNARKCGPHSACYTCRNTVVLIKPFSFTLSLWTSSYSVRLGDTDLSNGFDDHSAIEMEVADFILHPNFKGPLSYFDVGLLRLPRKITFSDFVLPVCLPTTSVTHLDEYKNDLVTLTGWGQQSKADITTSKFLRRTDIKIFGQRYVWSYCCELRVDQWVFTCSYCNSTHSIGGGSQYAQQVLRTIPDLFQDDLLCAGSEVGISWDTWKLWCVGLFTQWLCNKSYLIIMRQDMLCFLNM